MEKPEFGRKRPSLGQMGPVAVSSCAESDEFPVFACNNASLPTDMGIITTEQELIHILR
jgi:hypothetical protein